MPVMTKIVNGSILVPVEWWPGSNADQFAYCTHLNRTLECNSVLKCDQMHLFPHFSRATNFLMHFKPKPKY